MPGVALFVGPGNADVLVGISRQADEDVGVPRDRDPRRFGMLAKNNGCHPHGMKSQSTGRNLFGCD